MMNYKIFLMLVNMTVFCQANAAALSQPSLLDAGLDGKNVYEIFLGQEVQIPFHFKCIGLDCQSWVGGFWQYPKVNTVQYIGGPCLQITIPPAINCSAVLKIRGTTLNQYTSGSIIYSTGFLSWPLGNFSVRVIPHPLAILAIAEQNATAGIAFAFNIKNRVAYFDENVKAGVQPEISVNPLSQSNGLMYESRTGLLRGIPENPGSYPYELLVSIRKKPKMRTRFWIKVAANLRDRPIFRSNAALESAVPGKIYDKNLLSLLENFTPFAPDNPIRFFLDENADNSDIAWLTIRNNTCLYGVAPRELAGRTLMIYLRAHSNTGGDSVLKGFPLSVAKDGSLRPVLNKGIALHGQAGNRFFYDMSPDIRDPAHDPELQIQMDTVQPDAPWLRVSSSGTVLEGNIPLEAVGYRYRLKIHANNRAGGDSDPQWISLNVSTDPDKKPIFKSEKPILPLMHPGIPYQYDFRENRDIFPEYEDAPFRIRFSEGYNPPNWLKLENNQLFAEHVPEDLREDFSLPVIVSNIPGGDSDIMYLKIFLMQ